jgi:protein tyrosine/serine phosphatase
MPRYLPYVFGTFIAALLVGGPLLYTEYCPAQYRNLRVVREGVLLRSGQLDLTALKCLIHDHGIKTVITCRGLAKRPGEPPPNLAEEQYCLDQELNYHRITPAKWWAMDGSVPAEEGVRRFLAVMDDAVNYPVLLHCFAGIHRSGAFCAVYRMEYDRWSNEAAIAELRACGYRDLDDEWDLLGYLEQYRPRWQKQNAPEGLSLQRPSGALDQELRSSPARN